MYLQLQTLNQQKEVDHNETLNHLQKELNESRNLAKVLLNKCFINFIY